MYMLIFMKMIIKRLSVISRSEAHWQKGLEVRTDSEEYGYPLKMTIQYITMPYRTILMVYYEMKSS